MFYGLSHTQDDLMANKLSKILALSPCFLVDTNSPLIPIDSVYEFTLMESAARMAGLNHVQRMGNGISLKTMSHYEQNALIGRFQEFDDYFGYFQYDQITDEVPVENINTPIDYFYAVGDQLCPIEL